MTSQTVSPKRWRQSKNLSLAAAARLVGVAGKNPASTWQRWENGANCPPLDVVEKIEVISDGVVTVRSWLSVRDRYLSQRPMPRAA